jgi:hypothetical protein
MMEAKRKGAGDHRHGQIEWNKVVGSIRAIEVKRGDGSGVWHPHIHAYVLMSEKINKFHLSAEWERFTGDSFVVDYRDCKNGIVPGLMEVLKYVSKPTELVPADLHHLYETAKGSRFVDPQGILRGVPEPCIDSDDDDGLHGAYRDYILLWHGFGYRMESVGHRLEILKPEDPGYGAPRELVYHEPGSAEWDAGIAYPPAYMPPPRKFYDGDWHERDDPNTKEYVSLTQNNHKINLLF